MGLREAKQVGKELAQALGDETWRLIASHENCVSREWALVLLIETLYSRANFEETKRDWRQASNDFTPRIDFK
jgi:hypothetical protein